MSRLTYRVDHARQPGYRARLRAHPLLDGLVSVYNPVTGMSDVDGLRFVHTNKRVSLSDIGFSQDFDGATRYSTGGFQLVANPMTLFCVAKTRVLGGDGILMAVSIPSAVHNYQQIGYNTDNTARAASRVDSYSASSTTGTVTQNKWHSIAGVYPSNSSRTAYLDGVPGTAETTAHGFSSFTQTMFGALSTNSTVIGFHNGLIALGLIFNKAKSTAEVKALHDKLVNNTGWIYEPVRRSIWIPQSSAATFKAAWVKNRSAVIGAGVL